MSVDEQTRELATDSEQAGGIRRQYHLSQLAMKYGLSRADARRAITAAGGSRGKADEIAAALKSPLTTDRNWRTGFGTIGYFVGSLGYQDGEKVMLVKGGILWLLGVPVIAIIALALFHVI